MAEESLIPSVLCMSGHLPQWAHNTAARQADENGSACAQEIFSQDDKLLAQLLTVPVSAAGSRPPPPRASRGSCRAWPPAVRPVAHASSRSSSRTQQAHAIRTHTLAPARAGGSDPAAARQGKTPSSEAGMGFVMLSQLAAASRTPNLAVPLHLAIRQSGQGAIMAPRAPPR